MLLFYLSFEFHILNDNMINSAISNNYVACLYIIQLNLPLMITNLNKE